MGCCTSDQKKCYSEIHRGGIIHIHRFYTLVKIHRNGHFDHFGGSSKMTCVMVTAQNFPSPGFYSPRDGSVIVFVLIVCASVCAKWEFLCMLNGRAFFFMKRSFLFPFSAIKFLLCLGK